MKRGQDRGCFGGVEQCLFSRFPATNLAEALGFANSAALAGWSGRWPLRAAEARSRARGFPLALSDDDAGFIGIG